MDLEIAHDDPDAAWGHMGPVCVVLWKRALTAAGLDGFVAFSTSYGERHPGGWVVLSFPTTRMQLPPPEVRARISELTRNPGPNFKSSSTVIDAEGFAGAVMRSVLAGLALVGGKGAPDHVGRTPREALEYLATFVSFDVDDAERALTAFLTKVRAS